MVNDDLGIKRKEAVVAYFTILKSKVEGLSHILHPVFYCQLVG